ncbi:MAG: signal recognition particle protein Srp19, partial [Thermoplasmata archaeon]
SRGDGRRVAKDIAVPNASIEEIMKAAKKMGLNPQKEDKAYPGRWWKKEGRVIVDKIDKKTKILRDIATEIAKNRET